MMIRRLVSLINGRRLCWLYAGSLLLWVSCFISLKTTPTANFKACNQEELRLRGPFDARDATMIAYLKTNYLLPPSVEGYNLSTDPLYKEKGHGYSWPFIHGILKTLFQEERSKFFVEAGGFDGEFLSNTLWLERNQSWSGLLVEPQPQRFQEMVYKRRRCWIANACLSVGSYPYTTVMVSMETDSQSDLDSNIIRASSFNAMMLTDDKDPYKIFKDQIKRTNFTAQCFPLHSFLLALNQTEVDFLSLDLEGVEIDVFSTIPLQEINVRTVVFENYANGFDTALVRWMNRKGFNILNVGGAPDYFFINAKETRLIEKYRRSHHYLQELVDKKTIIKLFDPQIPKSIKN